MENILDQRIVAIIQARLGSRRLPGKVLLQIPPDSGVSMLELVIRKALLVKSLDDVIVVTPDTFIAVLCNRWNIRAYMPYWSGRDVLREYYEAATDVQAYAVVRLTADCPLLKPEIIEKNIKVFLDEDADLTYNTDESTGQLGGEGSDVECFTYEALEKAYHNAKGDEREHPTLWMRRHLRSRFIPEHALGVKSVNTPRDYRDVCAIVRK